MYHVRSALRLPCLCHPRSVWGDLPAQTPGLTHPKQSLWEDGGLQGRGPTPPTHLSLHRKFPVLGEAEGKAAEDAGGEEGSREAVNRSQVSSAPTNPTPDHWAGFLEAVAGDSPELALDLDPARAAQEGPGLVPLLHSRQAGAEHL